MAQEIQPIWNMNLDITQAMSVDIQRHLQICADLSSKNHTLWHKIRKMHEISDDQRRNKILGLIRDIAQLLLESDYKPTIVLSLIKTMEILIKPQDSDFFFRCLCSDLAALYHNQKYFVVGLTYALVGAYPIAIGVYTAFEQSFIDTCTVPMCKDIITKACTLFLNIDDEKNESELLDFRSRYIKNRPYLTMKSLQARIRASHQKSHLCDQTRTNWICQSHLMNRAGYMAPLSENDLQKLLERGQHLNIAFLKQICSSRIPIWVYPNAKVLIIVVCFILNFILKYCNILNS